MAGLHKLSPATIDKAQRGQLRGPQRLSDGGGLYLKVGPTGAASWVFRYKIDGRETLMGGGSARDVSLREARGWASDQRRGRALGDDPLAQRKLEQRAQLAQRVRGVTFRQVADDYIADFEPSWKNPKHRQQWRNTLDTYVHPRIGHKSVAEIDDADVLGIIRPLWHGKTETASRVRGRIEVILDYARAKKLRSGENPARWRGHLALQLPSKAKVMTVEHHAAVEIDRIRTVFKKLSKAKGVAAAAAAFCIATALRPGVVRLAEWCEIDEKAALWIIPAAKMKAQREHRVPLSAAALAILKRAKDWRCEGLDLIFPSATKAAPLSLASLSKAIGIADGNGATVHGTARSTFSDWAHERTSHPNEVIEMALAHTIKNKAEAAYRRGDVLDKRRALMADWGRHLAG